MTSYILVLYIKFHAIINEFLHIRYPKREMWYSNMSELSWKAGESFCLETRRLN